MPGSTSSQTTAPRGLKSMSELNSKSGTGDTNIDIKVGYNVEHERFGKGKVTKLEGSGVDRKATIFFPHAGAKTLLLKFAKLTILDIE